MKRVLLDTIAFDTLVARPNELPPKAFAAITEADQALVCQISLVELSNHVRVGRVQIDRAFAPFYKKVMTTFNLTLIDCHLST